MTTAPMFTLGYHPFHPDVSINYQLNRFSDGSYTSVGELTAAASRMEELFAAQAHFVTAGYDVVIFEGPGQGSVLEEEQLAMTPDRGPSSRRSSTTSN